LEEPYKTNNRYVPLGKENNPSSLITMWYPSAQSQEARKKSFLRGKKISLSYSAVVSDSFFSMALKTVFDRNSVKPNLTSSLKG